MHAGRHYSLLEILSWTRRETLVFVLVASVPSVMAALGCDLAGLPWAPIAVLGTAVAFINGFKSNAAYGRLWEARQIWGAIVNASRTWTVCARDFVAEDANGETTRLLVLRQVAWLTALRHQLRAPRAWETARQVHNLEYQRATFPVPEWDRTLDADLEGLLPAAELARVLAQGNRASAVLSLQSETLRQCAAEGRLTEFRHIELMRQIGVLFEQQGKCERIKNFPYPRQFATLNRIFVWVFIGLLPFGMATELRRVGPAWMALSIPLTVLVAWVFHTIDKIGESSENPFEGGPNDVPISAMSRGIEIDLRTLIDDPMLPEPARPSGNILM